MHTSMPEKKSIYKLNVYRDHSGKQSNFTKAMWQISIAKQFNLYSICMSWIEKTINFSIFRFLLFLFFYIYAGNLADTFIYQFLTGFRLLIWFCKGEFLRVIRIMYAFCPWDPDYCFYIFFSCLIPLPIACQGIYPASLDVFS